MSGVVLPYFESATSSTLKWALLLGFAIAVIHALTRAGG
jgi:ABC-type nickel/cobalt efflux system permease component RcnA